MSKEVRVRFAPSPTGYLHVGGARSALYNYLFAKNQGGKFLLRVEDTDQARSTDDALRMQIADLMWLGLKWDEGPHAHDLTDMGSKGPYRQSKRLPIYGEYAQKLIENRKAYYCFCTDEELEAKKELAIKEGRPPHYDGKCRGLSLAEAQKRLAQGELATVRFVSVQDCEYSFKDLVRGEITFPGSMVGDFVILRSDGMPVYNFCNVVDDGLMEITHVLRGEEHLSNTVRQMMIYEALGFPIPQFGHMSIILGADRQKLSKRHGATSCNEYRLRGYLPEAMNSFLALLGWSSPTGQEILSEQDLISQFTLDRLHPAAAVFDEVKLKWVNATFLRALPHSELWQRLQPFFQEAQLELPQDPEWQDRALSLFKTSMETLVDAIALFQPLSSASFVVHDEAQEVLSWESTRTVLATWKKLLTELSAEYLTEEQFNDLQNSIKDQTNSKGKFLFQPIRVAIIGKPQGAELKLLVPLLHRSELLRRVDLCLVKLG